MPLQVVRMMMLGVDCHLSITRLHSQAGDYGACNPTQLQISKLKRNEVETNHFGSYCPAMQETGILAWMGCLF